MWLILTTSKNQYNEVGNENLVTKIFLTIQRREGATTKGHP